MAIFVTFKTKDTMKSFFILLSLYYFLVVNVVSAYSVTFPSRVEIVMDEDFDLPGGPGNAHQGLGGDFLLEIKGADGAYAFGRFTVH